MRRWSPSQARDRTPPQRWRTLGVVFLALAAIRVLGMAANA
jgi:hypothetical protein